jgi:hypothetical protein
MWVMRTNGKLRSLKISALGNKQFPDGRVDRTAKSQRKRRFRRIL